MKTRSILNPTQALRGLRSFALAALAAGAALATIPTASAGTGFTGPFNPIAPDGSFSANGWQYTNYGFNPAITIPGVTSYSVSLDHSTLTLVFTSPAGVASSGKSLNSFQYTPTPANLPAGPLSYDWSVVFSEDVHEGELGFPGSAYDSGSRNLAFTGGTPYTGHYDSPNNAGLVTYCGWTPDSDNVVTCTITISNLVWSDSTSAVHSVVYVKGDAVPGVPDATFTALGVPAINSTGAIAVLGKWKSPTGSGAGIIASGGLVAKVGDEIPLTSGVTIKSLKDPVIDGHGHVVFPVTLAGSGISELNDKAILSNAPGGTLHIVAQEGTAVPDAPEGALWKSFSSVAVPGGGGGVLIYGFMQQGPGGIAKTNDNAMWAADAVGNLHIVLQEGTTQFNGKTVKSFAALKTLSKTPGQTHAFNARQELVAKVVFTDGFQAVVHKTLPLVPVN